MARLYYIAALVAAVCCSLPAHGFRGVDPRAACVANNCARAVTGTAVLPGKPDITSRQSDCSSYMTTTAITDSSGSTMSLRSFTIVPTYASACTSGSPRSAYSSACSCWGITQGIKETPGPEAPQCFPPNLSCGTNCCAPSYQACAAGTCVCDPAKGFVAAPPNPLGTDAGCQCQAGLTRKAPPAIGCA